MHRHLIYRKQITGSTIERPELRKMLERLRTGDIVVVLKLDRLSQSLADLVCLVDEIQRKDAGLQVLQAKLDTTTPQGKLFFHIFAAVAEFERGVIRERTKAGLESARSRDPVAAKAAAALLYNPK